jgi:hypothetical protein
MLIYSVWPPSCLSLVQDDLRIALLMTGTQPTLLICCNHVNSTDSTDEWTTIEPLDYAKSTTIPMPPADGQGFMILEHPCSTSMAI